MTEILEKKLKGKSDEKVYFVFCSSIFWKIAIKYGNFFKNNIIRISIGYYLQMIKQNINILIMF